MTEEKALGIRPELAPPGWLEYDYEKQQIPEELIRLERVQEVIQVVSDQIVVYQTITDRLRWFLGDYYNMIVDRFGEDQVLNHLHLPPDYPITIETIVDYAQVAREIPPNERNVFDSFGMYHQVVKRARSFARQSMGLAPNARPKPGSQLHQELTSRVDAIKRDAIERYREGPSPSSGELLGFLERRARELIGEEDEYDVAITHRAQRSPLTIHYSDNARFGSPLSGIAGNMSALEFFGKLVQQIGLSGKRARTVVRIYDPEFRATHEFTFDLVTPSAAGGYYTVHNLNYETIEDAIFEEENQ